MGPSRVEYLGPGRAANLEATNARDCGNRTAEDWGPCTKAAVHGLNQNTGSLQLEPATEGLVRPETESLPSGQDRLDLPGRQETSTLQGRQGALNLTLQGRRGTLVLPERKGTPALARAACLGFILGAVESSTSGLGSVPGAGRAPEGER